MICHSCGKNAARVRRTSRVYGRGRSTYLVENVPVVDCRACGERYLTARTLARLDEIHARWRKLAVKRSMRVARFGGAA
jgi:YgiT-type zinc finger domain-containing protein